LVILGGRKPCVVLVTSNAAEPSGFVVPIPTWAKDVKLTANSAAKSSNFITSDGGDWLSSSSQDDTRWNGSAKGTHDPCPSGFRVPTETELEAERNNGGTGFWGTGREQDNAAGAFASVLKLPLAGRRYDSNGTLNGVGSNGNYWSSAVSDTNARYLFFNSTNANMYAINRAYGFSVRCIKE